MVEVILGLGSVMEEAGGGTSCNVVRGSFWTMRFGSIFWSSCVLRLFFCAGGSDSQSYLLPLT